MKLFMAGLICHILSLFTSTAYAQQIVELRGHYFEITGIEANLIRTKDTPSQVHIRFKRQKQGGDCKQEGIKEEIVTDGFSCGFTEIKRALNPLDNCEVRDPQTNGCLIAQPRRAPIYKRIPKACLFRTHYCAVFSGEVQYIEDDIILDFSKLRKPENDFEEMYYLLVAPKSSRSNNLKFILVPKKTIEENVYRVELVKSFDKKIIIHNEDKKNDR
jgi:hypothetical protein